MIDLHHLHIYPIHLRKSNLFELSRLNQLKPGDRTEINENIDELKAIENPTQREEEILAKYQYPLEEFMTTILNVLLDLYEESGKYEPTPPLINWVKWLSQYHPISSWKLKLLNIIGYHRLCKLNKLIHQIYRHH